MTFIGAQCFITEMKLLCREATDPYCRKPMLWQKLWHDFEKNPSYINKGEVYEQIADLDLFNWYKDYTN